MPASPLRLVVPITALAALALTACGSSGGSSGSSSSPSASYGSAAPKPTTSTKAAAPAAATGSSTVALSADPSGALAFDQNTESAKAGTVTLKMANPAGLPHGIAIQGNGVTKVGQVVQKGGTSTVTANLKPGTYTYYCPVPGHKAGGMTGTLTVS